MDKCSHNRTVIWFPEKTKLERKCPYRKAIIRDEIKTIRLKGCLDCGKVWIEDYGK